MAATGVPVRRLPERRRARHGDDGALTDVAMLFVRCAGGISHHPDESVTVDDVALAIEAATRFACSI